MKIIRKTKKRCIKKIKKFFNFITLKLIYPTYYKMNSHKPVDENKVLFLEMKLEGVSNSFDLIYNKLTEEYDFDVHFHHLLETKVRRPERTRLALKYVKDLATAKYVFMSEGSRVHSSVKLRPETVVMQLWHGCGAFKRFGFSTAELIFGDTPKNMVKYPFYKNTTYVTVSSPEVVWAYEEAMQIDGTDQRQVVPMGVSRSDIYFDPDFRDKAMAKLYELMPEAQGKKIILYSPTFRGRVARAKTPRVLNVGLFNYVLSDKYVLLFKHHPIVKKRPTIKPQYESFARDMSKEMSIEELMSISDICISDYSSLVFEFSLLERPLLFFAYDLDNYCDWRGFYYPYEEMICGPVLTTSEELLEQILNIDKYNIDEVRRFRDKFMSSCDGHSTERIMEKVFGKEILESHKK